jgi:hypothetical protein
MGPAQFVGEGVAALLGQVGETLDVGEEDGEDGGIAALTEAVHHIEFFGVDMKVEGDIGHTSSWP